MQANFDSWDLVPVSIPARSRLHWIEPIGIGTPFDSRAISARHREFQRQAKSANRAVPRSPGG